MVISPEEPPKRRPNNAATPSPQSFLPPRTTRYIVPVAKAQGMEVRINPGGFFKEAWMNDL